MSDERKKSETQLTVGEKMLKEIRCRIFFENSFLFLKYFKKLSEKFAFFPLNLNVFAKILFTSFAHIFV